MTTVFYAWTYRATSGERNFIEPIKVSIFLGVVLAIDIMQEPQTNLEEKVNPSILKQSHFCTSTQCLVDQIEVQKPILVVTTDQMPDQT